MNWFLSISLLVVVGCTAAPVPKPRGFARVELPPHSYQPYQSPRCHLHFDYPTYGRVARHGTDSCFVDIYFAAYHCTWHITLRDFVAEHTSHHAAYEDYRKVIYHHAQKASEIYETPLRTPQGRGTFFEIYGEVPTSAQFFFTDSTRYAVMTSFYFKTALKNDSLAPVIDFMKQDLHHMVQTLRWE